MKRTRRTIELGGLSLLDVVSCGFGAIVLLLVLVKVRQPAGLEDVVGELQATAELRDEQISDAEGATRTAVLELDALREQISEEKERLARLHGDLSELEGARKAAKQDAAVATKLEGRLARARQELTEEMQRLLGPDARRRAGSPIGGVPVDSEYVVFIIDTSGSMQRYSWGRVVRKMAETLDVYPDLKGIQVMNDMGVYMFPRYAGKWIPDTPARREAILARLRRWQPFSNSSPVEGIAAAIRTYAAPDERISLYVFGDEFTGSSVQAVVDEVDRLNRRDAEGRRRVRIHAVGFPLWIPSEGGLVATARNFSTLMRELTARNGGAFVALAPP